MTEVIFNQDITEEKNYITSDTTEKPEENKQKSYSLWDYFNPLNWWGITVQLMNGILVGAFAITRSIIDFFVISIPEAPEIITTILTIINAVVILIVGFIAIDYSREWLSAIIP